MKTKIYAGIESIDVSGTPDISALVAAGNNAGVSYIFVINVSGQISVAIIDVAEGAELAKTTIDGKITALNATIIAKKIVDFILKSGPKPDPDAPPQEYAQADGKTTGTDDADAQNDMEYKTVYFRYVKQDGKSRRFKTSFRFDYGGVFSPYSSYKYITRGGGRDTVPSIRHISGSGIGGGFDFSLNWKYAEIREVGLVVGTGEMFYVEAYVLGKYPFILPSWDFVMVTPVLGSGAMGPAAGGFVLGSRVDVGLSELAYLRSEYLCYVGDIGGMSFKLGAGLDIGLGATKRAYLNPELLYSWAENWNVESKASLHSIGLRVSIGYRRGDARKEVQIPVKRFRFRSSQDETETRAMP